MSNVRIPLEQLVEELFGNSKMNLGHPVWEAYQVDGNDSIFIDIAITGLVVDNLKLDVSKDKLVLAYTKPEDTEKRTFLSKPRLPSRSFEKSWELPSHLDASKITSKALNGLLTIEVPIREESKPRSIEIG